ncbi:MAG TPA: glycoside hydrolase family 16 protein [Pyrinomonadaceae bacterium]
MLYFVAVITYVHVMFRLYSLCVLLVLTTTLQSTPPPKVQGVGQWQLVWADEFEYSGLPDAQKWGYDVGGHGWGNKELQYYSSGRKENARVENGHLIIEARREALEGREYTSARLVSKGKGDWTYGRFEVRAKLPTGRGTWPAIWMLPSHKDYGGWPEGGEIDIMEHVGFDPDIIHASTHTKSYHHSIGTQKTAKINVANARTGFNTYAVEWTPEEIRAFVNDQHYFTFKNERLTNPASDHKQWPFDKPFHLLLNIAVGGTWGGQKGVDKSIWPQRMEIDYVRVYQQSRAVQSSTPASSNDQKEAAKLERRERRLQLMSYLDGVAQKAGVVEPLEDRINVLIEVSDAFWFLDKQRAIALFTQHSTANPLKVSSLNSVPSSGGGMKSVRVTYPRLAGLSEVFAEASKHDLHQAMRVAQDLSSKPLSLALQASICRTSAERLAQEERN